MQTRRNHFSNLCHSTCLPLRLMIANVCCLFTGSIGIAMEYMFFMGKCMQTRRNFFVSYKQTYKDVCVCVCVCVLKDVLIFEYGLYMFRVAYMLYAQDNCCTCCGGKNQKV